MFIRKDMKGSFDINTRKQFDVVKTLKNLNEGNSSIPIFQLSKLRRLTNVVVSPGTDWIRRGY